MEPRYFQTTDLPLVAALQLRGIFPEESTFTRKRLTCRYVETPEVIRIREDFYSGRMVAPLIHFSGIVRSLSNQAKEQREVSNGSR